MQPQQSPNKGEGWGGQPVFCAFISLLLSMHSHQPPPLPPLSPHHQKNPHNLGIHTAATSDSNSGGSGISKQGRDSILYVRETIQCRCLPP